MGLEAIEFTLETPAGDAAVRLPLPGLYNVYNALAAAARRARATAAAGAGAAGLERFSAAFGRFERIDLAAERPAVLLLVKNPAGRERGDPHAGRQTRPPRRMLVALNDRIADGRDVSWIWDVDFEGLAPPDRTRWSSRHARGRDGDAAQVRRRLRSTGSRSRRRWTQALDRLAAPAPARSTCCPPTRRCSTCATCSRDRGAGATASGEAGVSITRRPPLPRAPEHLRRPRQHRGAAAPLRLARHRVRGDRVRPRRRVCPRPTSTTWAAARTATSC